MQKRVIALLIVFVLVIFLSNSILAIALGPYECKVLPRTDCGNDLNEEIVMGLSGLTNAHGEFPDLGTYDYVLCCGFGEGDTSCSAIDHPEYGAGVPQNKIIGLSAATNAHAEGTGETTYTTEVCYIDVVCVSTTAGCDANYPKEIFNLSSLTNAHIGTSSGYPVAICCDIGEGVGGDCDLTSAEWEFSSVSEGTQVDMIVQGIGCVGAAINYSIYEDDILGDDYITSIYGNYNRETWIAEYIGNNPQYYFTAYAIVSGDIITSSDPKLEVSQRPIDSCSSINLCSDYLTQAECESDKTLCNVASNDPNCNPEATSCECSWDSDSGMCLFSTSYQPDVELECENGYTLCYDPETELNYCHPGSSCADGEDAPETVPDGICQIGESCLSPDCGDGDLDSCVEGATCLGGVCNIAGVEPQNITGCGDGYTMCYDEGLLYCYPGNVCPVGEEIPPDGSCDWGDGCSSPDCNDGDIDSCLGDAYCQGGECYSPTATTGTCIYTETTDDNCDDGFLKYSWTVEWTGLDNPPSSCQDGSQIMNCPAQVALPFLNTYTIIIIIVVVSLAYYLIVRFRKKKSHSSKKSKKKTRGSKKK